MCTRGNYRTDLKVWGAVGLHFESRRVGGMLVHLRIGHRRRKVMLVVKSQPWTQKSRKRCVKKKKKRRAAGVVVGEMKGQDLILVGFDLGGSKSQSVNRIRLTDDCKNLISIFGRF